MYDRRTCTSWKHISISSFCLLNGQNYATASAYWCNFIIRSLLQTDHVNQAWQCVKTFNQSRHDKATRIRKERKQNKAIFNRICGRLRENSGKLPGTSWQSATGYEWVSTNKNQIHFLILQGTQRGSGTLVQSNKHEDGWKSEKRYRSLATGSRRRRTYGGSQWAHRGTRIIWAPTV